VKVNKIMSTSVVSVEMDDTLDVVKEIFDNVHFHHLLVVGDGKLQGVISDRDMFKALSPNLNTPAETTRDTATLNKRVHQIMTREVVTLEENARAYDAVTLFNRHRISCLPVVDKAFRPVGVISWRDIFKLIETNRERLSNR